MSTTFGNWIREKRLLRELSLRKFSELIGISASRWSKIERGYAPFPIIIGNLPEIFLMGSIVKVLELTKEEERYMEKIIRLHNVEYNTILPPDLSSILPVFWCSSFDKSLSEDKLNELIEHVKQVYEKE